MDTDGWIVIGEVLVEDLWLGVLVFCAGLLLAVGVILARLWSNH